MAQMALFIFKLELINLETGSKAKLGPSFQVSRTKFLILRYTVFDDVCTSFAVVFAHIHIRLIVPILVVIKNCEYCVGFHAAGKNISYIGS